MSQAAVPRILHVPFCYYPDAAGGTEVYVASLARAQREQGWEVTIAAPAPANSRYIHDGFEVHRYATARRLSLRELYGEGDPEAARNFLEVLQVVRPDLVHLHALTSGVSLRVAREVRRAGIPLVFTCHTPTVTCNRGTLLRWGNEICDGKMQPEVCAPCMLHGKGMSRLTATIVGRMPERSGTLLGAAGMEGSVWTALRSSELVRLRQRATRELLLSEAD